MTPCVIAVVGPSGAGKTRLIERLIPLLRKRGLRVGTVKHAHDRIDLDRPGKDSWRHVQAGAEAAAVAGPNHLLLVRRTEGGDGLEEALQSLPAGLELILIEGFHETTYPQIAVADRAGRIRMGRCVIAVVSDRPVRRSVLQFRPSQIGELAASIEEEWMKQWEAEASHRHRYPALSSAGV